MLNPHSKVYTPEIFSCLVCRMAFRTKLVPVQEVDCKTPVRNNRITLYHIVCLEYQGEACLQKSVYRCVSVPSNSTQHTSTHKEYLAQRFWGKLAHLDELLYQIQVAMEGSSVKQSPAKLH